MQAEKSAAANPAPTCGFIRGTRALAAWLGVSEVSVRRAVRNHTLPVIRFGGALLFRRADVEKTLARLTVPSVAMVRERKAGGAA